ncbi:uncharacterized protein IL334_005289 [Kwoniella shivajii]|uniref:Cryptochrome DASH n=1 Tax=Kwoniella shivajii TaxID=564305 RepID=A0ABZ1D2X9_9TREE|nr:hypothetical protein IL334_005289 [Kwoniella shivajii]
MNVFIHYHTLDLRLHDSPSISISHSPNNPSTHFLPIYIIDPRQFDSTHFDNSTSSPSNHASNLAAHQTSEGVNNQIGPNKTRNSPVSRVGGFHRTSPYRLKFLLEAVFDLKRNYKKSGGDLLIAYGKPEIILSKLVRQLKEQNDIQGIWCQREYTLEEISNYRRITNSLQKIDTDINLNYNDSKTLIPPKALPFKPEMDTPDVYTEFRKQVEGLGIGLKDGMLFEPLQTANIVNGDMIVERLKPFPDINLEGIKLDPGQGGFLKDESIENVYEQLVKPLLDSPPIGGWPSPASSTGLPKHHEKSAIPFGGSELSALNRLDDYIGNQGDRWIGGEKAKHYKETRNGLLGEAFSTKFSSWLSIGSLSPKIIGWRVGQLLEKEGRDKNIWGNVYWILFELLWRDYFQYTVLKTSLSNTTSHKTRDFLSPNSTLFNPDGFSSQISTYPKDQRPDPSQWNQANLDDPNDATRRWCEGRTGVPFIDANMRELRETGWMSNRGRQNVASFLTKDLYCDWRIGAEFFEMHLVDYDTCSNWGNWQYQAGVGNDPRSSRQFNPIKQSRDYDKDNTFVRTWIPELKDVDDEHVQTPWLIKDTSKFSGYPSPIVESPSWKKHYPGAVGNRHGKRNNRGKAKGNGKGPGGGKKNE